MVYKLKTESCFFVFVFIKAFLVTPQSSLKSAYEVGHFQPKLDQRGPFFLFMFFLRLCFIFFILLLLLVFFFPFD